MSLTTHPEMISHEYLTSPHNLREAPGKVRHSGQACLDSITSRLPMEHGYTYVIHHRMVSKVLFLAPEPWSMCPIWTHMVGSPHTSRLKGICSFNLFLSSDIRCYNASTHPPPCRCYCGVICSSCPSPVSCSNLTAGYRHGTVIRRTRS
jgi:hypothetical protein